MLELKEIIKTLPNPPVKKPDDTNGKGNNKGETEVEEHLKKFPENTKSLFNLLDNKIKKISDNVWRKVGTTPICSYYCPERTFVYVKFQKQGLRLTIFTNGQDIKGIKNLNYEKAGAKWGRMHFKDNHKIDGIMEAIRESYALIQVAIKNNELTGWYAQLDDISDDED